MAFTAIDTSEIQASEPNTTGLWTKVKNNFDDHEDRIGDIEVALNSTSFQSKTVALSTSTTSGTLVDLHTFSSIVVADTMPEITLVNGYFTIVNSSTEKVTFQIDILRDTTTIASFTYSSERFQTPTPDNQVIIPSSVIKTYDTEVTNGTYTYKIQWALLTGSNLIISSTYPVLFNHIKA